MASDSQPPAKRLKVSRDDDNSVSLLHDRPKQHAVSELYNPTMVKFHLYDREIDPSAQEKEVFVIPRGLICHRSEYFSKMFRNNFVEGRDRYVELDDVTPWVFRCFVGWLYTHRVFFDPDREDPDDSQAVDDSSADASVSGKDDDGSDHTSDSSRKSEVGEAKYAAVSTELRGSGLSNSGNKGNIAQSGINIIATQSEATNMSPTEAEVEVHHEDDFNKPVTWPWSVLFELYTFADKYATSAFRTTIFTTIQQKLLQLIPRIYRLPNQVDVEFAVERLLPSSPLFRLLVDVYAAGAGLANFGDTSFQQAAALEGLPSDFLAGCFIAARRRQAALKCTQCALIEGDNCKDAIDHAAEVCEVRDRDPCFYHDHGENEAEAEWCAGRWRKWLREARRTTPMFIQNAEVERQHREAAQE